MKDLQQFKFTEAETLQKYVFENRFKYDTTFVVLNVNNNLHKMAIMRALFNAKVLTKIYTDIGEAMLVDAEKLMYTVKGSKSNFKKYQNKLLKYYESHSKPLVARQKLAQFVTDTGTLIAMLMEHVDVNDISIFDVLDLMEKNPRFKEIVISDDHIDPDATPSEISHVRHTLLEELKVIIQTEKFEPYYTLMGCETGLRIEQFTDIFGMIGLSPDGENIIPYPVGESWLRGINNVFSWYVQNATARVAKILEKCEIDSTGYALKRSMFAYASTFVVEGDCGTIHHVDQIIKDEKDLKRFVGINYKLQTNVCTEYLVVKPEDTHLIGKLIHTRSPITCNHIDGKLCSKCVGVPVRHDIDIGLIIAMWVYGMAGQLYLSAKHNNLAVPIDHLVGIGDKKYIKNTAYNTIVFKTPAKSALLTAPKLTPEGFYESIGMVVNFENGETREFTIPPEHNTAFRVKTCYVEHDTHIINLDEILLTNKNTPKSALFLTLSTLFISGSAERKDKSVREIVKNIFDSLPEFHASVIGILTYKHIRDSENHFVRPNFSDGLISPTFIGMHTLLTLLPINESLPQGEDIGLVKLTTSMATFNGQRPYSTFMDALFEDRTSNTHVVPNIPLLFIEEEMMGVLSGDEEL